MPTPNPLIGVSGSHVDSVERLSQFEAAHPEVTVVRPAHALRDRWRAVVPLGSVPGEPDTTTLGNFRLTGLLDLLDQAFPPLE